MSITTVTAARILEGQQMNQSGEEHVLSWEKFPWTALAKAYNVNQQVPDSAGTATALLCGVKTDSGKTGSPFQVCSPTRNSLLWSFCIFVVIEISFADISSILRVVNCVLLDFFKNLVGKQKFETPARQHRLFLSKKRPNFPESVKPRPHFGDFRKRPSNQRRLKTLTLLFSMDKKH